MQPSPRDLQLRRRPVPPHDSISRSARPAGHDLDQAAEIEGVPRRGSAPQGADLRARGTGAGTIHARQAPVSPRPERRGPRAARAGPAIGGHTAFASRRNQGAPGRDYVARSSPPTPPSRRSPAGPPPRPASTPSSQVRGGVVSQAVAMPTMAAKRMSLAPRRTPRAITLAASATRNAKLTWRSESAREESAASPADMPETMGAPSTTNTTRQIAA